MELPFIEMDNAEAFFFLLCFLFGEMLAIRNLVFGHVKFVILSVLVFCAAKQSTTNLVA